MLPHRKPFNSPIPQSHGAHPYRCLLDVPMSAAAVALACRQAAVAFCEKVAEGCDERDLVTWLRGPYRNATHIHRGPAPLVINVVRSVPCLGDGIEDRLRAIRRDVLSALANRVNADFPRVWIGQGLVRSAVDVHGEMTWVPIDAPRATLHARVLSLFAVDCLHRPDAYGDDRERTGHSESGIFVRFVERAAPPQLQDNPSEAQ